MGIRRERPPVEQSLNTIKVRFPDGTVKEMPVDDRRARATPGVCCFCGEVIEEADGERIGLSARWLEGGQERTQSWSAHRTCLAERMHGSAAAAGPFFGE